MESRARRAGSAALGLTHLVAAHGAHGALRAPGGRGAPGRVRGREADAREGLRAAAICLTTCSDASNRLDARLTVGAQARLQGQGRL